MSVKIGVRERMPLFSFWLVDHAAQRLAGEKIVADTSIDVIARGRLLFGRGQYRTFEVWHGQTLIHTEVMAVGDTSKESA